MFEVRAVTETNHRVVDEANVHRELVEEAGVGALFDETAVLCCNDLTAIGVMRGLRAAGRRIPADISVVGYDDIELAAYVDPPLTTIRQSTDEMARRAVADLFERLGRGHAPAAADPDSAPGGTTLVPVELIVRGSSGPAPG